ncbi:hypothetical protein TorRG33x02_125770 [Trema orientale]|uniref:Uncharacterized protein n=1 Tax=Trema orientale TaxID=63057 RepID=A0A2P5F174_TREOI|nr:hypothetical protein TorRG33x02_125770 [Trema orientale]
MEARVTNYCLKAHAKHLILTNEDERERERGKSQISVQSSHCRTGGLTPRRTNPRFSPVADEANASGLTSIGARTTELEAAEKDAYRSSFLAKHRRSTSF